MATKASCNAGGLRPFTIAVPDDVLDDLRSRLARTRFTKPSAEGWRADNFVELLPLADLLDVDVTGDRGADVLSLGWTNYAVTSAASAAASPFS